MSESEADLLSDEAGPRQSGKRTLPSSSVAEAVFSQRIVNIDFYSAVPSPEFDVIGNVGESTRVPILRIYGATPRGQKTCTHVHGVFPYLTILYALDIEGFEEKIKNEVDNSLNEYLKPHTANRNGGPRQHVFEVVRLLGKTFYGYRHADELFLRIYFYNPLVIKKVADLLLSGSILGRKFQPYDAHIPYHLQFLVDYDLYGMNLVHFKAIKFRRAHGQVIKGSPVSSLKRGFGSSCGVSTVWDLPLLPEGYFCLGLERIARTALEIDVHASDIVTPLTSSRSYSSNPGIDAIWKDELERRRLFQVDSSQITMPDSQPRENCEILSTEVHYLGILAGRLQDLSFVEDLNYLRHEPGVTQQPYAIRASQVAEYMLNKTCPHGVAGMQQLGSQTSSDQNGDEEEEEINSFLLSKNKGSSVEEQGEDDFLDMEDIALVSNEKQEGTEEQYMENEHVGETDWDQSFLSNTILENLFDEDAEKMDMDALVVAPIANDVNLADICNHPIFQGDGQGESDSSDEKRDTSSSQTARKSSRKRTTPKKFKDTVVSYIPRKKLEIVGSEPEDNCSSGSEKSRKNSGARRESGESSTLSPRTHSRRPSKSEPENLVAYMKEGSTMYNTILLHQPVIRVEKLSLPIPTQKACSRIKKRVPKAVKHVPDSASALVANVKKELIKPLGSLPVVASACVHTVPEATLTSNADEKCNARDVLEECSTIEPKIERMESSVNYEAHVIDSSQFISIYETPAKEESMIESSSCNIGVQTDEELSKCTNCGYSCSLLGSQPIGEISQEDQNIGHTEVRTAIQDKPKVEASSVLSNQVQSRNSSGDMAMEDERIDPTEHVAHVHVPSMANSPDQADMVLSSAAILKHPQASPSNPLKMSPLKKYRALFKKSLSKSRRLLSVSVTSPKKPSPRSPTELSLFQIRRSISRSKSRKRRMIMRAKILEADAAAPDISRHEYEPLKQPPSYKHLMKIVKKRQMQEKRNRQLRRLCKKYEGEDPSSQECTPERVIRRYNVGSSSDEDNSDSENIISQRISQFSAVVRTPETPVSTDSRPRSILRSKVTKSARQNYASGKRKIHWDDDSSYGSSKASNKLHIMDAEGSGPDNNSELDAPTPKNGFGFQHDMTNLHDAKAVHQHQYMTLMSMELFCETRENLLPNPAHDRILVIFVYASSDYPNDYAEPNTVTKCFLLGSVMRRMESTDTAFEFFATEAELLQGFLHFFQELDPDILVGYEIEKSSWGYLLSRGILLGIDLQLHLSRLKPTDRRFEGAVGKDNSTWDGQIKGRIVLNLWRLLRHEITVQSYTYENSAYHILHRRVYRFSYATLTQLWNHPAGRVLDYYDERVKGNVEIIETLDMVNRTSELARLFGILFYEVLSRGSQFRVESMMLRVTRTQNFIPVSPSVSQRATMKAPEFVPLILEPISSYYVDPVAVLDFQSLYPSMMIAYNYDYASVIGRVEHLGRESRFELGCIGNELSSIVLKKLDSEGLVHVSPAGVAFVKPSVRKGILPEMLEQILETRQMVKRAMKKWKNEGPTLQKVLDSRQLGLKLIANVTYGYTSANFSGRMPCVEIADSIVSKGRETLQRAIDLVKANFDKWGGDVIYGDTDSLFVVFRGKTRLEAFTAAREIADEVTQLNPKPVKLKFEKIYHPCILQTKKRYVGYSYETEDQVEPTYDAKGIETVRRDGCPAIKKILEKSLHVLFTTNDTKKVQNFVQLQFRKLFTGRVSLQDYIFAKEYRGREGYRPGACVPALEIAKKLTQVDPRAEPLRKQRVPYVIIYDKPTLPLIRMVRTPLEFASNPTLRLNAHYYIEKGIIPALTRCLGLADIDVTKWYKELPRKYLRNFLEEQKGGHGTLDDYIQYTSCPRCDAQTEKGICELCDGDPQGMTTFLIQSSFDLTNKLDMASQICVMCSGDDDKCENMDCPVFHKLLRYERDEHYTRQLLSKLTSLDI